ncbi:hypothetical protein COOONC_21237, partial [Cooperia oncophora]
LTIIHFAIRRNLPHPHEWISSINSWTNFLFQKWDPGLSSDACNEARGVVASNAPHKFTAERTFARGGSVPVMIGLTLINGLGDETQTQDVRNLPARTRYGCNSFFKGNLVKVVCVYKE